MALTTIPKRNPAIGQHNILSVSLDHQKEPIAAARGKNAQASKATGCSEWIGSLRTTRYGRESKFLSFCAYHGYIVSKK